MNGLLLASLFGLALATAFFYHGGVRSGAHDPGFWSIVFGLLWPVTVPLVLMYVIIAFKRD